MVAGADASGVPMFGHPIAPNLLLAAIGLSSSRSSLSYPKGNLSKGGFRLRFLSLDEHFSDYQCL